MTQTQDRSAVHGYPSPLDGRDRAADLAADLAQLQRQTVDLLARLDRPPRNLRIQAGEVSVDITWPDHPEPEGRPATPEGRPATPEGRSSEPPAAPVDGYLTSPSVGVFYHAREPGAEPFVSVGSVVRPGQQIGIIEAMKLMMPVEADRAGRITAVVKGNGESVEFAEPLFALDLDADRG